MIFVDSSVWIDYINNTKTSQTAKLDSFLGVHPIVVGDLVLAEVLQGCRDSKVFNDTVELLGLANFVVVGGYQVALRASRNFIELKRKGITVRKTIDTLIATRCILSGFDLLHNDRDFDPFEQHLGLRCIH